MRLMMRGAGWRTWLITAAVFAASTAFVVLAASLLLGIAITFDQQP